MVKMPCWTSPLEWRRRERERAREYSSRCCCLFYVFAIAILIKWENCVLCLDTFYLRTGKIVMLIKKYFITSIKAALYIKHSSHATSGKLGSWIVYSAIFFCVSVGKLARQRWQTAQFKWMQTIFSIQIKCKKTNKQTTVKKNYGSKKNSNSNCSWVAKYTTAAAAALYDECSLKQPDKMDLQQQKQQQQ